MMNYNYFIPLIYLGPLKGYTFIQEIPLNEISKLIIGKKAIFEITRKIMKNTGVIYEKKEIIKYHNKVWKNKEAFYFSWDNPKKYNDLCYIETQMNLLEGKGLVSSSMPSFYVNYISPNNKNYMSCGNEKYGNPRVIMQMKEFGMWVDGYPAININRKKNTTYSLVIINPYKTKNTFIVEINSLGIKKNLQVSACSVLKVNFYNILKKNTWTGQFYIYGKRRAIIYVVNHAFENFNIISTLEHSDPYRAELTYQPRLQYLRNQIHKKINKIFKN